MSFQTHKTFVHLQNTNEDIFNDTWDFCSYIKSQFNQNFYKVNEVNKLIKQICKFVNLK